MSPIKISGPRGLTGPRSQSNVKGLSEYRNRAIHLYNARGPGALIHPFLQQNVLNYRDSMLMTFNKDLADSMTWQLLPLGATAPAEVGVCCTNRGHLDLPYLSGSNCGG